MPVHSSIKYKVASIKRLILTTYYKLLATRRSKTKLYVGLGILLLIAPIVLISLFKPQSGEAAWFDEAYGFRRRVPITNSTGSTQTDFQVELTLDTQILVTSDKLREDCNDMRFTANNGELLPHWLEPNTCDSATTKVFVKVPRIETSGTDIFWYYGNPSASSGSQADQTFIKEIDGPIAAWPLDDEEATQSYARVVNSGAGEGRNLFLDNDMETSGTSNWGTANSAVITKESGNPHGGSSVLRVAYGGGDTPRATQNILTVGKAYRMTGYARSDGTWIPRATNGSSPILWTGTNSTEWQYFDVTFVASQTIASVGCGSTCGPTPAGGYAEFDDVSVVQVNIPSSSDNEANLLADGDMEAEGISAWTAGLNATLTKETTSPQEGSQNLKIARSTTNNPQASQASVMTIGKVYRISGYARSDGSSTPRIVSGSPVIWSGNQSTSWQPFDFLHVATSTNIVLQSLNADSGTEYTEWDNITITEDRGIRPGELLQDGDMEASGTGVWTAQNGAVPSKEVNNPHGGSQVIRITNTGTPFPYVTQSILVAGKTYRATGWARGDGNSTPPVFYAASLNLFVGTTSTDWQYFDKTFTATNGIIRLFANSNVAGYAEFDDVSITEVSPLSGTFSSVADRKPTLGTDSNGHLSKAYTFDGTNDLVNIYSSDLNSVFNPDEGTLVAWAKVSDAGVWTDGNYRNILRLSDGVSDTNAIYIRRQGVSNNSIQFVYVADGSSKAFSKTGLSGTDWMQVVISWSKTTDQVNAYFNGAQVGSTQTDLSTWTGNLSSTLTTIGASTTSGSSPWSGQINDVRLYDRALTADEISAMYSADTDIQAYNTSNYLGKELLRKYDTGISVGTFGTEEIGAAPIAYWKFDDAQGQTVTDSSNNGNDGTLGANTSVASDDPTWQAEDQCVMGKCLRFDKDTNQYVSFGNPQSLNIGTGAFSTSLWIKAPNLSQASNFMGIISKGGYPDGFEFRLAKRTTDYEVNGFIGSDVSASFRINPNEWVNVALTRDNSGNWKVYKNGILEGSSTNANSLGSGNWEIGRMRGDSQYDFEGFIDEVKIYPYARTEAQVREDYNKGYAYLVSGNSSLSEGLVGYWKMDEASWNGTAGEVKDSSGNGYHGTAYGGANTGTGIFGNGGFFDATDDRIVVSNFPKNFFRNQSYTVSMWFNPNNTTGFDGLFGFQSNGLSPITIEMRGATMRFESFDDSGIGTIFRIDVPNGARANEWQHVVSTYDYITKSAIIYLNGARAGSVISSGTANTNNVDLTIGAVGWDGPFDGLLDETRIYNRALSPGEVQDLYNYAPGPVGYWNFDEGEGTTAFDTSGNGNNGTLTNGPTWTEGKFGNALSFDGVDDRVTIPNSSYFQFGMSDFTISSWFRTSKLGYSTIIDTFSGNGGWYYLLVSPTGEIDIRIQDASGGYIADTVRGSGFNNGTWHHVSMVVKRASSQILIFVDGQQQGTPISITQVDDVVNPSVDPYIGRVHFGGGHPYNGQIDDVKIYNYARTQEQILQDMQGNPVGSSGNVLPEPLAWYRFDEQSGQTVKNYGIGGTSLNGTLGANSGASTDDPTWKTKADCKVNGCLSFDGDYVSTSTSTLFNLTEGHTISAWIYPTSFNDFNQIFDSRNSTSYSNQYQMYLNSEGKLATWMNSTCASTNSVEINNWNHATVTYSSGSYKVYLNGKLENSCALTKGVTTTTNITIGGRNTTYPFYGLIDEVKIYNVALTEDQVKLDFNAGAAMNFGTTAESEASLLSDGEGAPPIAYWSFDEKEGTTVEDKSGNGNTGAINGATWTQGRYGSGLEFDGVDDYVDISTSKLSSTITVNGNYTIETWFKTSSYLNQGIFDWGNNSSDRNGITFGNGRIAAGYYNGTQYIGKSSTTVTYGAWHHVVYINSSGTVSLYIDGVFQTGNNTPSLSSTGKKIGYGSNIPGYFNGSIDEVKIYNYARTPAQIAYDYNRGAPVAWYRFDECEGTTIKDHSGNGNNGTLNIGASGTQTSIGTCETSGAWSNGSEGKINSSMNFDGTDDYVSIPDSSNFDLLNFSLSAWIKTSNAGSGRRRIISQQPNGSNYWVMSLNNNVLEFGSNLDSILTTRGTALNDNTWHHVTITRDTATNLATWYVDGIGVGTAAVTLDNSYSLSAEVRIGAWVGSEWFNGQIDDVRIYNYALSPDQVKQVYNGGAAVLFSE